VSKRKFAEDREKQLHRRLQKLIGPTKAIRSKSVSYDIINSREESGLCFMEMKYVVDGTDEVPAILIKSSDMSIHNICIALHQTTEPKTIGKRESAGTAGHAHFGYGKELAKRGYGVICPDYPLFGDYHISIDQIYDEFEYQSVISKALTNHVMAINVASHFFGVTGNEVTTIGHSLGGTNSIFLGIFDDRVRNIVCSAGFSEFDSYARHAPTGDLTGWARKDKYMPLIREKYSLKPEILPISFKEIIQLLSGKKIFFNIPRRDDVFSFDSANEVIDELCRESWGEENVVQVCAPDVGHDFPVEVRNAAYNFIAPTVSKDRAART
jgi:pimeloyl-ACP methyl ester carboxylesterase